MALLTQKIIKLDTSGIEEQLSRLNYLLGQLLVSQGIPVDGVPTNMEQIDPDDYSSILYTDETSELIQQHLDKRIGGVQL